LRPYSRASLHSPQIRYSFKQVLVSFSYIEKTKIRGCPGIRSQRAGRSEKMPTLKEKDASCQRVTTAEESLKD